MWISGRSAVIHIAILCSLFFSNAKRVPSDVVLSVAVSFLINYLFIIPIISPSHSTMKISEVQSGSLKWKRLNLYLFELFWLWNVEDFHSSDSLILEHVTRLINSLHSASRPFHRIPMYDSPLSRFSKSACSGNGFILNIAIANWQKCTVYTPLNVCPPENIIFVVLD